MVSSWISPKAYKGVSSRIRRDNLREGAPRKRDAKGSIAMTFTDLNSAPMDAEDYPETAAGTARGAGGAETES